MPKQVSPVVQTPYLRVASARVPTLTGSSAIQYAILTDTDRKEVLVLVTAAEGGGNFNSECVPLSRLEAAVDAAPADKPFPSKQLRPAFEGRSNNNPPYTCAVLLASGLLARPPGSKFGLVKAGDWEVWRAEMLAREGEPILFPPTLPERAQATEIGATEPGTGDASAPRATAKKNRRGGNRLIQVPSAGEESTRTANETQEDADDADHP